jgi:hypothetical protein
MNSTSETCCVTRRRRALPRCTSNSSSTSSRDVGRGLRFEAHLRPLVDAGRGLMRSAFAYLWALKSTG